MGISKRMRLLSWTKQVVVLTFIVWVMGCQIGPSITPSHLANYRELLDFSGLGPEERIDAIKVSVSPPKDWTVLPLQKGPLYTHQQWKSPSGACGVGTVYVRMPLPFSANTLVWLAKKEYSKRSSEGRIIAEWTDELGRPWFEAENSQFHVRGYAMTDGFDAWIVYCGSRAGRQARPGELTLAARSAETIIPIKNPTASRASIN